MPKKHSKVDTGSFSTPFTKLNIKPLLNKNKALKEQSKAPKKRAYAVTFKEYPELFYITFEDSGDKSTHRAKAKWQACKYFKNEIMHPDFQKRNDYGNRMKASRGLRVPDFDKYAEKGKIPIPELMRVLNVTFKCSICGKYTFKYQDYKDGRCFIIEGEHDINSFTEGIILCYECKRKYLK